MIWFIDFVAFVSWICLAPSFLINDEERKLIKRLPRRQGLRQVISVLGILPIVGHLFATHGWVFVLIFLFVVSGAAFSMRFLSDGLPTWATVLIALVAIFLPGYSYFWL